MFRVLNYCFLVSSCLKDIRIYLVTLFLAVGAYLSPDVVNAQYSVLEKVPEAVYCWSSKGPW